MDVRLPIIGDKQPLIERNKLGHSSSGILNINGNGRQSRTMPIVDPDIERLKCHPLSTFRRYSECCRFLEGPIEYQLLLIDFLGLL